MTRSPTARRGDNGRVHAGDGPLRRRYCVAAAGDGHGRALRAPGRPAARRRAPGPAGHLLWGEDRRQRESRKKNENINLKYN